MEGHYDAGGGGGGGGGGRADGPFLDLCYEVEHDPGRRIGGWYIRGTEMRALAPQLTERSHTHVDALNEGEIRTRASTMASA